MFGYLSPIGQMLIFLDRNINKVALSINGVTYGHYDSVVAAADDVYMFATGYYEWDSLVERVESVPESISEWLKISTR